MASGLLHVDAGRIATGAPPRPGRVARSDPVERLLRLQRTAGNAAVGRLLRAPGDGDQGDGSRISDRRRKIVRPPGTGYDGLQVAADTLPRTLTDAQKELVSAYRARIATIAKGTWAREAGSVAAKFEGTAYERAVLYGELQRQIMQVDINWNAAYRLGADGSHIFYGTNGRAFVVSPDGRCFSGATSHLAEQGGRFLPAYDQMIPVPGAHMQMPPSGGGGGKPPTGGGAPPPPAEGGAPPVPPSGGAKTGPSVKSGGSGKAGTAAEGAAAAESRAGAAAAGDAAAIGLGFWESMGIMFAVSLLIDGAIAWLTYEKNVGDPKVEAYTQFLADKLSATLEKAVEPKMKPAREMTIARPDLKVYAVVTYDLDYRWSRDSSGAKGIPGPDLAYVDARLVELRLEYKKEANEELLSKAGPGDWRDRVDTKRLTYSIELNPLGERAEMRHWRALLYDAGQVARRGLSARAVAESSHHDVSLTPADEREERRRTKLGLPPLRAERERAERLLWVAAYIDYTSSAGLKKQYDEAVRYYTELEQRNREAAEPLGCVHCAKPGKTAFPPPIGAQR